MARVPVYDREVAPQINPRGYIEANVNQDTFGGSIAQAGKNIGNAISNLGTNLLELKDRVDKTKILELKNKSDEWSEKNLYSESGYLRKSGKDAYGQSEALMKDYDKYMNDELGKLKLSRGNYILAKSSLSEWRKPINRTSTVHDFQQGIKWSETEIEKSLNNSLLNAVNQRNNPEEIQKALSTGYQVIDWGAGIQHLDADTVKAMKEKFSQELYGKVLSGFISDNSLKAVDFFEINKNKFSPDNVVGFGNSVKNLELTYTSRETAKNLLNLPTQEVYSKINAIADTEERNAVYREYSFLQNQRETIQREIDAKTSSEIMNQLYTLQDSGKSQSEIMSRILGSDLSFETKTKLLDTVKKMNEWERYGNNWADYNYLTDLMSTDHEAFLKQNPATYNLSQEQYQKIKELQRQGKNIQFSTEAQLSKAVNELFPANFGWQSNLSGNGIKDDEYKREMVDLLSLIERKQGKAFDLNHLDAGQIANIASGMGYKNANEKNKNLDESKELYMWAKKHGDVKNVVAKNYMLFKSSNKREPNPDEIYDICKRSYNYVETQYKQKATSKLDYISETLKNINSTAPKKGETKALTYLADTQIPALARKHGIKLTSVPGSRYRPGSKGYHGYGQALDVSMSEHNRNTRGSVFTDVLALPDVKAVGTSDPILLKNFAGHGKMKDLRSYDRTHGTNHENHIHIVVDTRYGGSAQGK